MLHAAQLTNFGFIPGRGKRFFSLPKHPDQLWGSTSILFSGY